MTGEMSAADVTKEAYPLHFAIAEAMNGHVHPFDTYQGPYVLCEGGKLWIVDSGDAAKVFNERNDRSSEEFWPHGPSACRQAQLAARSIL